MTLQGSTEKGKELITMIMSVVSFLLYTNHILAEAGK